MIQNDDTMSNISINDNENNNHNNNIHKNILNKSRKTSTENNYSFNKYTKPAKTRLKDLGDTSYLNSVLYCLGNIRNIASYFLNPENFNEIDNNINTMPLSFAVERLIYHLYEKDNDKENIYSPEAFWKILSKLNITYKTLKRRNPNDLMNYILNVLHNELNQKKKPNLIINEDINDRNKVIKTGVINFKNSDNSIISNNLNWFEIKQCKCNKCKNTTFEFLTFVRFNLDIESTHNNLCNNNNDNDISLTINDCIKNYNEPKKTKIYCSNCKSTEDIICNSKIFLTSHVIIFCINRNIDFSDKNKLLQIKLNIIEKIDLSNFIEEEKSPKKYQLIGIISIFLKEQRYINFCVSPVDKKWYYYNNEKKVEEINIEQILKMFNENEKKEYMPTTLIYKAI